MQQLLDSKRIYLREFYGSDEENLLNLDSDPEVMRYITGGLASTRRSVKEMMKRVFNQLRQSQGKYGVWAAIEKETDHFIGWFHLFPLIEDAESLRRVYLGYRLVRASWGKGYATEVSNALVEKAFHDGNVNEVCAQAMKSNFASQNVMKKIGMTFVSDFQEPAFPKGSRDAVLFSISKQGPSPC